MKTLNEIANAHGTDKGTVTGAAHGYTTHYEQFFQPLRHLPVKLLEIGAGGGESIRTWLEYFPQAEVYGVDISPGAFKGPLDRYEFVLGDQSKIEFWELFIYDYGTDWDIIIDDGGHLSGEIITSFNALWPHVKPGGIYAIEDLACAYDSKFQTPGFQNHMAFVLDLVSNANRGVEDIHSVRLSRELAIITKAP